MHNNRNATDLNHGWMWSDDNDDNHRDVLHQLPASLRYQSPRPLSPFDKPLG